MNVVKESNEDTSKLDLGIDMLSLYYPPDDPNERPNISYEIVDVNNKDFPKRNKQNINILEYSFKIDGEKLNALNEFINNDFGTLEAGLSFFYKCEYRAKNNICILIFDGHTDRKHFSKYAFCKHPHCRSYVFKGKGDLVSGLDVNVFVKSNYETNSVNHNSVVTGIVHLNIPLASQMRGIVRKVIQNKTSMKSNSKPHNFMKEHRTQVSLHLLKAGRRNDLSDEQVRTMRYECNAALRRHPNAFIDAYYFAKENSEIVFIQYPLFVMMSTTANIEAYLELCEKIVHFDATGSLVADMEEAKNKIFLYSLVAHHKESKTPLPLALFLMSQHSSDCIEECFMKLRTFCHEKNIHWPIFNLICIDQSSAMLLAIIRFFYGFTNTSQYVNHIYELLQKIPQNVDDMRYLGSAKVIPINCRSHFTHNVAKDGSKMFEKHDVFAEELYTNSIKAIGKASNLETVRVFFEAFVIVFNSKFMTERVEKSVKILQKFIQDAKEVDSKFEGYKKTENEFLKFCQQFPESENHENFSSFTWNNDREPYCNEDQSVTFKSSKYFIYFSEIHDTVSKENECDNGDKINPYYNKDICQHILKKYIASLPLWTNIVAKFIRKEKNTTSNGIIEEFNYLVKYVELENVKKMRLTKVLRHLKILMKYLPTQAYQRIHRKKCSLSQVLAERSNTERNLKKSKVFKNFPAQSLRVRKSKAFDNEENCFFPKYPLKCKEGWSKKNSNYILKARSNKFKKEAYSLSDLKSMASNEPEPVLQNITPKENSFIYSFLSESENSSLNKKINEIYEEINSDLSHSFIYEDKIEDRSKKEIEDGYGDKSDDDRNSLMDMYDDKIEINSNGTIKNFSYYKIRKDFKENLVALFLPFASEFYPEGKVPPSLDGQISILELSSLDGNQWIFESIIDYSSLLFLEKSSSQHEVTILTVMHGKQILNNSIIFPEAFPKELSTLLIIPMIVKDCHFIVAVANFKKKTFAVLDPKGDNSPYSCEANIFECFLNFLNTECVKKNFLKNQYSSDDWMLVKYNFNVQRDDFNCGIYVISFIKNFIDSPNLTIIENITDPTTFREDIKKMLIDKSAFILDYCLYCCRKSNSNDVYCSACARIICETCLINKNFSYDTGRCCLCEESICYSCNLITDQNNRRTCININCRKMQCIKCYNKTLEIFEIEKKCLCEQKKTKM